MYDRVDWWLGRSSSPEYQEAYDRIASLVAVSPMDVFLEVACGNGELLKRFNGRARKLVGSDVSKIMLEEVAQNLYRNGVNSEIFDRQLSKREWDEEVKKERITLYLDDIIDTTLPESYFDSGAFIFPDVRTNKLTPTLRARILQLNPKPQELTDEEFTHIIDQALGQEATYRSFTCVRQNGTFVTAMYTPSLEQYDQEQVENAIRRALFGGPTKLLHHSYHHKGQIGTDAYDSSQGYRILVVKKL